ncbi:MAG TPA: tetratricopeptide repeat protein [Chthoniobacterales bacterium]|nr:tetratricopeptide repeat protein [Chthoniobacterales bacterium]
MKKIFAVLIIFLAVFISYAPAVRNGFVWDDTALILRDPLIRSWRLIPEGFNHFLFLDATPSDFYRPIQRLTYTIDYAAFAFQAGPYHIGSLFWHVLAAIALLLFAAELLLGFGFQTGRARMIALLAALVWAIHPVQSAAVVYISGRADPLAAAFGFLGLFLILRASASASMRQQLLLVGGSGAAFLLSALSKESGLIFPAIGLALFLFRKNWAVFWKTLVVTMFVGAIYFNLRIGAEHFPAPRLTPPPPLLVRPIIVARAVAEYTGLIVLPLNLHMDRDVETQPSGFNETSLTRAAWRELQTLAGIVLIAAFFYWMWRARKRNPAVFVCLLFAFIAYLPVSGIAALNATVAEHWIYLPSAFLFLAVALELGAWIEKEKPRRSTIGNAAVAVGAVWLLFLGVRTFVRTFDWKDQRTFLERTVAQGGDSARMLINLGGLELTEGKLDDAAMHLHAALQKKPDQPLAILNLAAVALKQNDFKLARQLLTRATQMPLVEAQAHEYLAVLENKESGKVNVMRMRLASRTGPPNWEIEKRYIRVLDETGSTAGAINELLTCLRTQWYRADSWKLLSELETKVGHADQAANALAQARSYDVHLGDPTAR